MNSPLTPTVCVVVHPIDRTKHTTAPEGFRWAVMVGGAPPHDLEFCANAGWCPTKGEAWFDGETAGATACRALRLMGVPADYQKLELDNDPVPADQVDRINSLGLLVGPLTE